MKSTCPAAIVIFARSDWAAFTATPVLAAASSFTFPHVNRGMDWFSLIGVVNASDAAQTVTFSYSTATNPNAGTRSIAIPGNGAIRMTATDLFGPGQDSGFVKIAATGKAVAFTVLGTVSGSGVAAAPGQRDAQTEFFFPGVDETAPNFTGIALLNDTAQPASVELFLIAPKGD